MTTYKQKTFDHVTAMKKLQFAKVAPLGVKPSEDYDKKGLSIQSECPKDLFLAKKGYQQTKLS